jgi:hypothetical protein
MPALARGGWPRGRCWALAHAACRPWGAGGWPVVTDGTAFLTDGTGILRVNPPRRYRAVTLARWAHQPAQIVPRPARGDRPGPVVRLPERGRVRESGLALRHGAPGVRNPDLVADDTLPGNRNRMSQRVEARRALHGVAVTVSHPASPAGLARPLDVPGKIF